MHRDSVMFLHGDVWQKVAHGWDVRGWGSTQSTPHQKRALGNPPSPSPPPGQRCFWFESGGFIWRRGVNNHNSVSAYRWHLRTWKLFVFLKKKENYYHISCPRFRFPGKTTSCFLTRSKEKRLLCTTQEAKRFLIASVSLLP